MCRSVCTLISVTYSEENLQADIQYLLGTHDKNNNIIG